LAPNLSAKSQGSWISWQEVFKAVVFRSMKTKNLRVSDLHHILVLRLKKMRDGFTI
jgi:hypothetical protein